MCVLKVSRVLIKYLNKNVSGTRGEKKISCERVELSGFTEELSGIRLWLMCECGVCRWRIGITTGVTQLRK